MYLFISFLAGVVLFYAFLYFPFSGVLVCLLSSAYLAFRKQFLLFLLLILGTTYAFLRYEPPQDIPYIRDKVAVAGALESFPEKTDMGTLKQTFRIKSATDIENGEQLDGLSGKEITLFSDRGLDPARGYELIVKFLKSRKRLNPGELVMDDIRADLVDISCSKNKTKSLHLRIEECRQRVNNYVEENFSRDSGAFISSITTGRMTGVTEELRDAFNATGLTHILSISGSHFGLFSVLLFGMFRLLINALPYRILQRVTIFLTPSQVSAALCLPFMLAYLGLSGASIPAVRSFIMIALFLAGLLIDRKGLWLNSLLFAAFAIIIWEPGYIFSLSFQLSFLAVLCIGFSLRKDDDIKDDGKTKKKKLFGFAASSLLITLSASIGTAPLVAYYFHYFSVISPLSNLLISPLIGFVLIPLSVFSSLVFLMTGHFVTTPVVSAVSETSLALIRWFSKIPFADLKIPAFPPVIILLFYAGFIFYFLFNRKKYLLFVPFIPIAIYLLLSGLEKKELSVTFLDVGQGDSSVTELPDGSIMVTDTGRTGRETSSFLRYRGKETIDFVALSHSHPDHTGGLDYILSKFRVKELWDSGRLILPYGVMHRSLNRGDLIEGEGYRICVLHPYPSFYTADSSEYIAANNDSLVLRVEGRRRSFLFTGDIEEEAEEDVSNLGRWLKSDVIKVPHHGGKASLHRPFLEEVSADIAVISCGRDNSFGHPHQETLDALGSERIMRTDVDGAVKISETARGLDVKTWKNFQFERASSLAGEIRNFELLFEKW
jgi:competence protein ComEC